MKTFLTKLAAAHKATARNFEHYGHIYFFLPMAVDHFTTAYGIAMLAIAAFYSVGAIVSSTEA